MSKRLLNSLLAGILLTGSWNIALALSPAEIGQNILIDASPNDSRQVVEVTVHNLNAVDVICKLVALKVEYIDNASQLSLGFRSIYLRNILISANSSAAQPEAGLEDIQNFKVTHPSAEIKDVLSDTADIHYECDLPAPITIVDESTQPPQQNVYFISIDQPVPMLRYKAVSAYPVNYHLSYPIDGCNWGFTLTVVQGVALLYAGAAPSEGYYNMRGDIMDIEPKQNICHIGLTADDGRSTASKTVEVHIINPAPIPDSEVMYNAPNMGTVKFAVHCLLGDTVGTSTPVTLGPRASVNLKCPANQKVMLEFTPFDPASGCPGPGHGDPETVWLRQNATFSKAPCGVKLTFNPH